MNYKGEEEVEVEDVKKKTKKMMMVMEPLLLYG